MTHQSKNNNPYDLIKSANVTFQYYESKEEGLIGDKIVDEITTQDLLNYPESEGVIGVVVETMQDDIVQKIKSLPQKDQERFDIRVRSDIQGSEFTNVIIAVK